MNPIIVLDAVTANSIAAGEVVERPASVVKELCENALDAEADVISIAIENGGIKRIRVTDNGSGMSFDAAALAFQQHATSKLKLITDLDSLVTMGFRGEALPSIAAVSKVEMKTRTAEQAEGALVRVEGGRQTAHRPCGTAVGTTIIVDSLFYNTPARYKFLKKDTTEANRIIDVVERLVLARPDVSFRLLNNGRQVLHSPGNNDLASAIYSVFSKVSTADLLPLESIDSGPVAVAGYIAGPEQARKSRQWQFFFVNNRIVKSPLLTAALEEGFRSYLMKGKFPAAFIKLALPANLLDVNVHPQKTEVRFWDDKAVFSAINHAVKAALVAGQGPDMPFGRELEISKQQQDQVDPAGFRRRLETPLLSSKQNHVMAKESVAELGFDTPQGLNRSGLADPGAGGAVYESAEPEEKIAFKHSGEPGRGGKETQTLMSDELIRVDQDQLASGKETGLKQADYSSVRPVDQGGDLLAAEVEGHYAVGDIKTNPMAAIINGRYVGTLFSTYIIIEGSEIFYLIDQHAAHEKINFERLLSLYRSRESRLQPLLAPLTMEVSTNEAALVESEQTFFREMGFELELFGRDTMVIRAVPTLGDGFSPVDAVQSLLDSLSHLPAAALAEREPEAIYDILATMACKASVKAHDHLSPEEVEALLKQMANLDNPWQCPHGRPSVIELRDYELEKLFKRVV